MSRRHRLLIAPSADRFGAHLRDEAGIGLIELLIAMTILAVAISAIVAVFASSIAVLSHAGKEGTAITLADRQLEAYRSMPFSCIPVAPSTSKPGTCTTATSPFSGFPDPYSATQTVSGATSPDHRGYTVNTVVVAATGSTTEIRVCVRAGSVAAWNCVGQDLAHQTSYFSSNGTSTT
ncbi:MAG: type II secretion system protein [Actinobacteria bacterium]|nr:type II secretion system protein [Actinomycetota bacterium]